MGVEYADWFMLKTGISDYVMGQGGPGGAKLSWGGNDQQTGEERTDSHLDLPGQACTIMGEQRMMRLLKTLSDAGSVATRVDIAIDDYVRRVGVLDVMESLDGQMR